MQKTVRNEIIAPLLSKLRLSKDLAENLVERFENVVETSNEPYNFLHFAKRSIKSFPEIKSTYDFKKCMSFLSQYLKEKKKYFLKGNPKGQPQPKTQQSSQIEFVKEEQLSLFESKQFATKTMCQLGRRSNHDLDY